MISLTQNFAIELCTRIGWALLHSIWQFAAIGLVTWFILALAQRRSANFRYIVACTGLVAMFACFVVTLGIQLQSPFAMPSVRSPVAVAERIEITQEPAIAPKQIPHQAPAAQPVVNQNANPVTQEQENATAATWSASFPSWQEVWRAITQTVAPWSSSFAYLWIAGVAFLSFRNISGWVQVNKLKRLATKPAAANWTGAAERLIARMKIRRSVKVLESLIAQVPIVIGWLRPVILVPVSLAGELSTEQIEAILAHELAHIRRHDYLVNLLQTALETLLFYHPAVWIVSRRIREERELCCDDVAVQVCEDKLSLGEALTLVAATQISHRLAVAASGNCSSGVFRRVRRLFETPQKSSNYVKLLATIAVFAFLSLTVVGFTTVRWQKEEEHMTVYEKEKELLTPTERAAELQAEETLSDADAFIKRIMLVLEKKNLTFLDDKKLEFLRNELREYFKGKLTVALTSEKRRTLLEAAENYATRSFNSGGNDSGYIGFRATFDTLKWRVWVAVMRPELDDAQIAKRKEQRAELHRWIDNLPDITYPGGEANKNENSSWQPMVDGMRRSQHQILDRQYDDPLEPYRYEPLSDEEFASLKKKVESYDKKNEINFISFHIGVEASRLMQDKNMALVKKFPHPINRQGEKSGSIMLIDVNEVTAVGTYGDVMKNRIIFETAPADPKKREAWIETFQEENTGNRADICFDAKRNEIVAVRGAKLALLDVKGWYLIDKIGIDELKQIIKERGVTTLSESLFREIDPRFTNAQFVHKRRKSDAPFFVIQTKEGGIAVVQVHDWPRENQLSLELRQRPLDANLPLHPGDGARPMGIDSRSSSKSNEKTQVAGANLLTTAKRAAEQESEAKLSDAEALAGRVVSALDKKKFTFLDEKKLEFLRVELRDYLKEKITTPLAPDLRKSLLDGVESFISRRFYPESETPDLTYIEFRSYLEVMKWQLWVAATRPPLDAAQLAKRNEQRTAMHRWIDQLPNNSHPDLDNSPAHAAEVSDRLRKKAHSELNEVFNDSLDPFFYQPFSPEEMIELKKRVHDHDQNSMLHHISHFTFAEAVSMAYDAKKPFSKWPLPNNPNGYGVSGTFWEFKAPDHNYKMLFVRDSSVDAANIYVDVMKKSFLKKSAPIDHSEREAWLEKYSDHGADDDGVHGDLCYDTKRNEIIGVRGAKLAAFHATSWSQVDQLRIDQLKKLIRERGKTSLPHSLFRDYEPEDKQRVSMVLKPDAPFIVVQTKEGGICVVRVGILNSPNSLMIWMRTRPLIPNLPLHPGDDSRPTGNVIHPRYELHKAKGNQTVENEKLFRDDNAGPANVIEVVENKTLSNERGLLQGTWKLVSINVNGKDVTAERKNDYYRLWVDGNKITANSSQTDNHGMIAHQESEVHFVIDPKKSPKQLTTMGTDFVSRAIYNVEKDSLSMAYYSRDKSDQLPVSFESDGTRGGQNEGLMIHKFERIPDAEAKRQNIAGIWKFNVTNYSYFMSSDLANVTGSAMAKLKPNEFSVSITMSSDNKIKITAVDDNTTKIELDRDVFEISNPEFGKGVLTFKLIGENSTKEFRSTLFEDLLTGTASSSTETSVFEAKRVKSPKVK